MGSCCENNDEIFYCKSGDVNIDLFHTQGAQNYYGGKNEAGVGD
jgi:hypothetical protein